MTADMIGKGQHFVGYVEHGVFLGVESHIENGQIRRTVDGSKIWVVLILPFPNDSRTAEFYRHWHEALPSGHPQQFADGRGLFRWVSGVRDKRSAKVHLHNESKENCGGGL